MSNSSPSVAPRATLTVVASATTGFAADLTDLDSLVTPPSCRINYVVRNSGSTDSAPFDVVFLIGDRPVDRHSYRAGLDAGRALASYFRIPARLLDRNRHELVVRVEGPALGVACCVVAPE